MDSVAPSVTLPDTRAALRAAQAEAVATATAHANAASVAARAMEIAAAAEAALATHDGVDAAVARYRAGLLQAGGRGLDQASLPRHLVDARQAQRDAQQDYADAVAAAALLAADAQEAGDAARQAKAALRAATSAVMLEDALSLVDHLHALEQQAARARAVLAAYAGSFTASDPPLAWPVAELRHHDHAGSMLALLGNYDAAAEVRRWSAYRAALTTDADATLSEG